MENVVIENDIVRLKKVEKYISCVRCKGVLVLKGKNEDLIKSHTCVKTEKGYIVRCGHCKVFNIIEGNVHKLVV